MPCRMNRRQLRVAEPPREERVANRTSIGLLSVSVRRSSLIMVHFAEQYLLHAELPNSQRFGVSYITNFLMGRLDPSARFGRTKTWHGTPIASQNDRHFRNSAGTAAQCP